MKGETTMQYKRILVGFDGSSYRKKALKAAESIAKHYDAQLYVVYVEEPSVINQRESVLLSDASGPQITEAPVYHVSPLANVTNSKEEPSEGNVEPTPLYVARNQLGTQVDAEFVWLSGNPT